VHVAAVVADAFAPIGLKDTLVPFAVIYRPLWLGFGAAASDLLLAVLITSMLRHRVSHRLWRFVHWFSYLAWPLVVVHGLGTGSDTRLGFVLALYVGCVAAVILAVWWRLAAGWPDHLGVRLGALGATAVAPIVLAVWLGSGPLAAGWSSRAGTPQSILARVTSAATPSTPSSPTTPTTVSPAAAALPASPFTAELTGTQTQSAPDTDGNVTVRILTTMTGGADGVVDLELVGQPLAGGGVVLGSSAVTMGPNTEPALYRGAVFALRGDRITADVSTPGRPTLELDITAPLVGVSIAGRLSVEQAGP